MRGKQQDRDGTQITSASIRPHIAYHTTYASPLAIVTASKFQTLFDHPHSIETATARTRRNTSIKQNKIQEAKVRAYVFELDEAEVAEVGDGETR
jgi:hypothetical protein